MTYNIQHKNDGKNYVARDGSGNVKISYKTEIVTNGLVVNLDSTTQTPGYAVGNTWYDSSGNNNHAKLYNGVTYDGRFFVFDGVDEYAEITNSSTINNCLNSDFTFDSWVYCQSQVWVYPKIFSKGAYNGGAKSINGSMRDANNNIICWQHYDSSGVFKTLHATSFTINSWQNITYTRSSGIFKFYLNGVLKSTVSNNDDLRNNYNVRISSNFSSECCRQKVMSFRQYNRGLIASEVLQNYNASIGKTTQTGFVSLAADYSDRSFVTFNTSEINKINFNYVLQTDETTLRKSQDGSLVFVKWTGSVPSFVNTINSKQSIVGYNQISSDIGGSTWVAQTSLEPSPYPYFYLNSTENETIDW
jgi:hypothetical protein